MALAPLESHHAPVDQLPVDPADAVIGKRWNGSDVPRWGPRLTFFYYKNKSPDSENEHGRTYRIMYIIIYR